MLTGGHSKGAISQRLKASQGETSICSRSFLSLRRGVLGLIIGMRFYTLSKVSLAMAFTLLGIVMLLVSPQDGTTEVVARYVRSERKKNESPIELIGRNFASRRRASSIQKHLDVPLLSVCENNCIMKNPQAACPSGASSHALSCKAKACNAAFQAHFEHWRTEEWRLQTLSGADVGYAVRKKTCIEWLEVWAGCGTVRDATSKLHGAFPSV